MVRNVFWPGGKTEAFNELLEAISKGIELLSKDSLNADIVTAWVKYAKTTVELVDSAFVTSFSVDFASDLDCWWNQNISVPMAKYNHIFGSSYNPYLRNDYIGSTMSPWYQQLVSDNDNNEKWKTDLYLKLQKLLAIAKKLPK